MDSAINKCANYCYTNFDKLCLELRSWLEWIKIAKIIVKLRIRLSI